MKRIIRQLYIDPASDLSSFKDEHVRSAHKALTERLEAELAKTYRWLAVCTVAVMAGHWGGDRRLKRRLKLLSMINTCRSRLGWPQVEMESTAWARHNLYYGYGATSSYGHDRGLPSEATLLLGLLDSHGPEAVEVVTSLLGEVSPAGS